MLKAEILSEKWTVGQDAKPRGQLWKFEDNLSAEGIILPASRKGLYLFHNPPENFSTPTHVDRSWNWKPSFYSSVTGFCKKSILVILDQWKVYLECLLVSWFSFCRSKIRGRIRISSDNHRPILYHVVSFIQWEPAEIIRWELTKLIDIKRH